MPGLWAAARTARGIPQSCPNDVPARAQPAVTGECLRKHGPRTNIRSIRDSAVGADDGATVSTSAARVRRAVYLRRLATRVVSGRRTGLQRPNIRTRHDDLDEDDALSAGSARR